MKILYYLSSFPKLSQSFVLNEVYEFERKGHDVVVCARNGKEKQIAHEEFGRLDAPIYYLENPTYTDVIDVLSPKLLNSKVLKNTAYRSSLGQHVGNLLRTRQCIEFVEELGWDIDHVHSHFATPEKFTGRQVASYYDVPFTITTHAYDLYSNTPGGYTKNLLQGAERVVTISEYNRRYIQENFVDETPVDVVRAGIRPEKFSPTEQGVENRVLTVARFVEKKGLKYAIEAVDLVSKEVPEIEYHIIGSGELEDDLRRRVERLGVDEKVEFLGNVTDQRLLTELDEARCFLLPCVIDESGDRDGIPVALMEAMAMKTPPVSTTVSGIPELIDDEKNGLLVAPRESEAVADTILRLLRKDDEWNEYRENAREKVVNDFNSSKEAEKLKGVFEEARADRQR